MCASMSLLVKGVSCLIDNERQTQMTVLDSFFEIKSRYIYHCADMDIGDLFR